MIRIEVTPEILIKSGIAKVSGKPYEIHEQVGYAHLVDRNGKPRQYPERVLLRVERNERGDFIGLPAGDYQPTSASFYVGDYGQLNFSPRLVAIARSVPKAA